MSESNMPEGKIMIKPLSVNDAWQGRRFKTEKYVKYVEDVLLLLPNNITIPEKGELEITFEFGMSSRGCDWDNPCKPFGDILQKKYGYNDNRIYDAHIRKRIVRKGEEYIKFTINNLKEK